MKCQFANGSATLRECFIASSDRDGFWFAILHKNSSKNNFVACCINVIHDW